MVLIAIFATVLLLLVVIEAAMLTGARSRLFLLALLLLGSLVGFLWKARVGVAIHSLQEDQAVAYTFSFMALVFTTLKLARVANRGWLIGVALSEFLFFYGFVALAPVLHGGPVH